MNLVAATWMVMRKDLLIALEDDSQRDMIPRLGWLILVYHATVPRQQIFRLEVDFFVAEFMNGTGQLQTLPLRHVKLGPHFDVELEGHGPFVRQLDGLEVQIRLADRRKDALFAGLGDSVHQQ